MSFIAYEYSIMIWQYMCIEKKNREKAMEFLSEYEWVLQYGTTRKTRLIYIISKIAGIRSCANILDFYMKCRKNIWK